MQTDYTHSHRTLHSGAHHSSYGHAGRTLTVTAALLAALSLSACGGGSPDAGNGPGTVLAAGAISTASPSDATADATAAGTTSTNGIISQTALKSGSNLCVSEPYLGWNNHDITLKQKVTVRFTNNARTLYIDTTVEPGPYKIGAATFGNVPDGNIACIIAVLGEPALPPQRQDSAPETAARPAYNTGQGFFVANGVLYDPSGHKFRIRGVNRVHWDIAAPDIAASGANTERINIDFSRKPEDNAVQMNQIIARKNVPMPGNWAATSSSDPAKFNSVVQKWVDQASGWKKFDRYMILNIANEWGPEWTAANPSAWKDAYISAIGKLRAAGYTSTLCIDTGQWGQDDKQLLNNAKAVFDADPQKNVIFSVHVYSVWFPGSAAGKLSKLADLGVPVIVGEFGPGRGINGMGLMTPLEVIQAAERNNIGWLAWAWDDYNQAGYQTDDNWFALTYKQGIYRSEADLTKFGKTVVLDPTWGLLKLGKKATYQ